MKFSRMEGLARKSLQEGHRALLWAYGLEGFSLTPPRKAPDQIRGLSTLPQGESDFAAMPPINGIPRHRMPYMGHMHANLVRPARRQLAFDERGYLVKGFQHLVMREGRFAAPGNDGHFLARAGMAAYSGLDRPGNGARYAPHYGPIDAA